MAKLFIKKIIILLLLSVSAFASISTTKVKYEGAISLFGKVAEAYIVLEEDSKKQTYKMKIKASSIGIVKTLTSNREDIFISEGKIKDGVYVPYKFIKIVKKTDYLKKTIYSFDYKSSKVLKEKYIEELVDNNSYDIINLKIIYKQELVKSKSSKYIELRDNDYLSMFLNLSVNKLKNGNITYIDQNDDDNVLLINNNQFEVSKDNGNELYRINFSKDKSIFFNKAIAIDIAFYGDAYLQKISEEKSIIN